MVAVAASFAASLALLAPAHSIAADNKGELAFNNACRTCHSIKAGDNRMGPSLNGVFGKKAGSGTGYGNYSQGLASSGVVWDEATLDKFIANPDSVIPNNNMKPYTGISDAAVRKQIVEYLKSSGKSS
jgi:cytochrome c